MEIQEVAAADMQVVLQFINGELAIVPKERLHSLVLATDRLQVLPRYTGCFAALKSLDYCAATALTRTGLEGFMQKMDFASNLMGVLLFSCCPCWSSIGKAQ